MKLVAALTVLTLIGASWVAYAITRPQNPFKNFIPAAATCPTLKQMSPRGNVICGSKRCVETGRLS